MTALHFIAAHWREAAALAVAILPSLINALVEHPEVENWLHWALDVASFLQRKGSEGGPFKLPLKASRPPALQTGHTPTPRRFPPAAVIFVGLGIALTLLHGCCTLHGTCSKPVADIVDCGSAAIKAHAVAVLPAVRDVLYDGTSDWEHKLELIAVSAGADAVACAVTALLHDLEAQAEQDPGKFQTSVGRLLAHERSKQYLASRGKQYK